jgi:hypothetical protein
MWWTRPSLSVSVNVPFERVLEHVVEHVCGALCGCEPGEDHVQRHADLAVEGDPIGGIGRQLGLSGRPIVGRRRGRGLAPPAARAELVEGEAADDHDQPGPHVVDLIDYMSFVAVATIGLLVPLSCMQSGLGVVVDRLGGGLRDLLAAPVSRPLIVAGNLVVAVALSAFQVAALLGASALRGAEFQLEVTGVMWFAAATLGFAVAMYGAAEILANRMPTQEEYIGRCQPSPSSPSSSPARSSRSAPCPPASRSSASCCRSPMCSPSCDTASSTATAAACTTSGA